MAFNNLLWHFLKLITMMLIIVSQSNSFHSSREVFIEQPGKKCLVAATTVRILKSPIDSPMYHWNAVVRLKNWKNLFIRRVFSFFWKDFALWILHLQIYFFWNRNKLQYEQQNVKTRIIILYNYLFEEFTFNLTLFKCLQVVLFVHGELRIEVKYEKVFCN